MLADGTTREQVVVSRDDEVSTRWLLFRRKLPDLEDLAGEVLAGARLGAEPGRPIVAPADGEPSAPFYLFFPTKIRSGLPFLLHGYFEVNAARTDFYEGATERNEPILDELAQLVRAAVEDMASTGDAGLASLADLLGEAQDPEDELARKFRDSTLDLLDEVAWVPLEGDSTGRRLREANRDPRRRRRRRRREASRRVPRRVRSRAHRPRRPGEGDRRVRQPFPRLAAT